MKPPRQVPSWDDYFLAIARTVATRSKDPDTQVGCVVVDERHRVVLTGYNGAEPGVDDDALDWSRPAKYAWIRHAEWNAMHGSYITQWDGTSLCTLYCTGFPCSDCMQKIATKGIKRVVCGQQPIHMVDHAERAKSLAIATAAGIKVVILEVENGRAAP